MILDNEKAVLKISQPTPKTKVKLYQFLDLHRTGRREMVNTSIMPSLFQRARCKNILKSRLLIQAYRCQLTEIEHIKAQWNSKKRNLREKDNREKDIINAPKEKCCKDLQFLKNPWSTYLKRCA